MSGRIPGDECGHQRGGDGDLLVRLGDRMTESTTTTISGNLNGSDQ